MVPCPLCQCRGLFSVLFISQIALNMEQENKLNFVPYPRSVLYDYREGKITPNEFYLYMFIRYTGNQLGIAPVNLDALVIDLRHRKWSKNHITKLLLALKRKRYLDYKRRSGQTGNFSIKFPDFIISKGVVTKLPQLESTKSHADTPKESAEQSEVEHVLPVPSQRLKEIKDRKQDLVKQFSSSSGRGSYNDTDNDKERTRPSSLLKKEEILVGGFKPHSHEEERCREIAIAIGERTMSFLLGTLHKHGFLVISGAWNKYQTQDISGMKNKAAYFNSLVTEAILVKNNSP